MDITWSMQSHAKQKSKKNNSCSAKTRRGVFGSSGVHYPLTLLPRRARGLYASVPPIHGKCPADKFILIISK
jgi:hypothetical protein